MSSDEEEVSVLVCSRVQDMSEAGMTLVHATGRCHYCMTLCTISRATYARWRAVSAPKHLVCRVCYEASEQLQQEPPAIFGESLKEVLEYLRKESERT